MLRILASVALGAALGFGASVLYIEKARPVPPKADLDFAVAAAHDHQARLAKLTGQLSLLDRQYDAIAQFIRTVKGLGLLDQTWWCWNGGCARSEPECQLTVRPTTATASPASQAGSSVGLAECVQMIRAFCADDQCYPTYSACKAAATHPKACRGVE